MVKNGIHSDPSADTDRQVREKLIARGVAALTDAELLSVVIGDGTGGATATQSALR